MATGPPAFGPLQPGTLAPQVHASMLVHRHTHADARTQADCTRTRMQARARPHASTHGRCTRLTPADGAGGASDASGGGLQFGAGAARAQAMSVARRRPALPPAAEKSAQSARAWPGPIPKPRDRRSALGGIRSTGVCAVKHHGFERRMIGRQFLETACDGIINITNRRGMN